MLPGMMGTQGAVLQPNCTLLEAIKAVGAETSLQICIDIGDSRCYPGSGQNIIDQSGNSHDLFLGADGTGSNDPTFTGTAGRQSSGEYFLGNGIGSAGSFCQTQAASPSWIQPFHKDNATFTVLEWVYIDNVVSKAVQGGGVSTGAAAEGGIAFGSKSGLLTLGLDIYKTGGALNVSFPASTATCVNNSWNMLGATLDEGAGNLNYLVNSTVELHTGQTYPTSDTSSVSKAKWLADASPTVAATNRGGQLAIWSRALTSAQIGAIYTATRQRYGV